MAGGLRLRRVFRTWARVRVDPRPKLSATTMAPIKMKKAVVGGVARAATGSVGDGVGVISISCFGAAMNSTCLTG